MTDEELARSCARIVGEWSAAACALRELERRRAAGEDVEIIYRKRVWLVGPRAKKTETTE